MRDVSVDHDVEGHALRKGVRQSVPDTQRESGDSLIGRNSFPAQGERRLAFALDEIESLEVFADRIRKLLGIDVLLADVGRLQHLQVFPGQERPRTRDVDRVAAQLDAVLGGSEGRGADALAGRQQRPGQGAGVHLSSQCAAQQEPQVSEFARLPLIDVFSHTAGKHHSVDPFHLRKRLSQEQALHFGREGALRDRGEYGLGHPLRDSFHGRGVDDIAAAPMKSGLGGKTAPGRI